MASDKHVIQRINRPGIPMSEESLAEYLKSFADIQECIDFLYKQQSSLLTKGKKCDTVKTTNKTKEKPKCVHSSTTRKKPLKK